MIITILIITICALGFWVYKERVKNFSLKRKNLRLIDSLLKKEASLNRAIDRIKNLETNASSRFIQESIINANNNSKPKEGDMDSIVAPTNSGRLLQ